VGITVEALQERAAALHESNPMMGHRGVRLGITYPEVTEMQIRAVFDASAELLKAKKRVFPEIMIPVVATVKEIDHQFDIIEKVYREVLEKHKLKKIPHLRGTMIEVPRAALVAGSIARTAEFFSYGTNDLTQLGWGFSRDDVGAFVPDYLEKKILSADPFQTIDQEGVGELIRIGIERGRAERPDLKVGICGEHGGEAESVKFCHRVGMDYVSCSPFRVPIARLAAAQAVLEESASTNGTGGRRAAPMKQRGSMKQRGPGKQRGNGILVKKSAGVKRPAGRGAKARGRK
jgi:pyruvate,orthophosphate dikinase